MPTPLEAMRTAVLLIGGPHLFQIRGESFQGLAGQVGMSRSSFAKKFKTTVGSSQMFASCADGTLSVVHQDTENAYTVTDVIQTESGARAMAFDPTTGSIYVPTANWQRISPTDAHPVPRLIPETFRIDVWTSMARNIAASIDWPGAVLSRVR